MDLAKMNKVEKTKVDVSKHVGNYAKIADVTVEKTQHGDAIKVVTEIVETIETEGNKKDITVFGSKFFSITELGEIVVGSKLDKLMEAQNVDQPLKLIGTKVQLLKNENGFLTF